MRGLINWVGAVCVALAFVWAYKISHGNSLQSFSLAVKVILAFVAVNVWLKLREEKKASGLSNDQFMLKKAGGPEELLKQAKKTRVIAFVLAAMPLGVVVLTAGKSLVAGLVVGGLLGVIFIPCAAYLFWIARKTVRVAEQADPLR